MPTYLEFETKIKTLQESITTAQLKNDIHAIEILQKDLDKENTKLNKIYDFLESGIYDKYAPYSFKTISAKMKDLKQVI